MLCGLVSRNRRSGLVRYLARKCMRFLECYENSSNYDFGTNGELFVLKALSVLDPKCVFDVGSNVGDWAAMANGVFPKARIYCFEIMEPTFEKLQRRHGGNQSLVLTNQGLSDSEGVVALKYFPEVNTLTTVVDYPHEFAHQGASGRVITGDSFVEAHGIGRIDFVKIDVEGAEGMVLNGLAKTIKAGKIDAIQFEYGKVSILNKFLLYDFYAFFKANGYVVGKIYPDYVDFRDYSFDHEDFRGPNFLAVRKERGDMIGLLGR